jgi:hypothetical protein
MSAPPRTVHDTPALSMRLSVPAEGALRGIARELATAVAARLGVGGPEAQAVGEAVEGLASSLGNGKHADAPIMFEFREAQGELVIEGQCSGKASEIRHPLAS